MSTVCPIERALYSYRGSIILEQLNLPREWLVCWSVGLVMFGLIGWLVLRCNCCLCSYQTWSWSLTWKLGCWYVDQLALLSLVWSVNAPFRKISNSAQCGRFALILWRLVNGVFHLCFLGQIVTWQYNPILLD